MQNGVLIAATVVHEVLTNRREALASVSRPLNRAEQFLAGALLLWQATEAFELHTKCKEIEVNVIVLPLSRSIEARPTLLPTLSQR